MTPQEAAIRLHERLHAKEPRAWELVLALKKLEQGGSTKAAYAINLLKAAHQKHMRDAHNVIDVKPEDGSPTTGYYPFPKTCSAGVCFNPSSQTGATMLTPQAVSTLKASMQRAAASKPAAMMFPVAIYSAAPKPKLTTLPTPKIMVIKPAPKAAPPPPKVVKVSSSLLSAALHK